jgi:hypothetical protein
MASYENVDLYIKDDTPSENPVEGVVVRAYDSSGTIFYTQQITDSNGHALMLLPSGYTFSLRFYRFQTTIANPQLIEVKDQDLPSPTPNVFDISAHVFSPPEAVDPRLCRCSGFFLKVNGDPQPNVDIHIIGKFDPILLDGKAVINERVSLRTDRDGYMQVDLVRFAEYDVTVEGFEDCLRTIRIPDRPSSNFPDLLFPVVERVSFVPAPPFSLSVGQILEVTPSVYSSGGRLLDGTAQYDLRWSSSDEAVIGVNVLTDHLELVGLSAGAAYLQAERLDTSVVRIPDTDIVGVPASATVT